MSFLWPGIPAAAVFTRSAFSSRVKSALPGLEYVISADAASTGTTRPGIGGYGHGHRFRFPLDSSDVGGPFEKMHTSPNDARAVQAMRPRLTLRVLSSGKLASVSALDLCTHGDHRRINGWVRVKMNFWSNRAAMLVSSKDERSHYQPDDGGHDDILRGASCGHPCAHGVCVFTAT